MFHACCEEEEEYLRTHWKSRVVWLLVGEFWVSGVFQHDFYLIIDWIAQYNVPYGASQAFGFIKSIFFKNIWSISKCFKFYSSFKTLWKFKNRGFQNSRNFCSFLLIFERLRSYTHDLFLIMDSNSSFLRTINIFMPEKSRWAQKHTLVKFKKLTNIFQKWGQFFKIKFSKMFQFLLMSEKICYELEIEKRWHFWFILSDFWKVAILWWFLHGYGLKRSINAHFGPPRTGTKKLGSENTRVRFSIGGFTETKNVTTSVKTVLEYLGL